MINKVNTVLAFNDKERKKAYLPPVFFQKQLLNEI